MQHLLEVKVKAKGGSSQAVAYTQKYYKQKNTKRIFEYEKCFIRALALDYGQFV